MPFIEVSLALFALSSFLCDKLFENFDFEFATVSKMPLMRLFLLQEKLNALLASSRADFEKVGYIFILQFMKQFSST